MCVWHDTSGDTVDVYWKLYRTGQDAGTGAEQAKRDFDEFYVSWSSKQQPNLGFAEEGHSLLPEGQTEGRHGCALYARDGNVVSMAFTYGPA